MGNMPLINPFLLGPPRCTRKIYPWEKLFSLRKNVMIIDLFIHTFGDYHFRNKLIDSITN